MRACNELFIIYAQTYVKNVDSEKAVRGSVALMSYACLKNNLFTHAKYVIPQISYSHLMGNNQFLYFQPKLIYNEQQLGYD